MDDDAPVLYVEPGSSWWPVLWGPLFAVAGAVLELVTGPVHALAWVLVGIALGGAAGLWVQARRRALLVRLTTSALTQGRETLATARIAEFDDIGTPIGAKVLGGGWSVPRKFDSVPIKLDDGTTVLAWARDGDALREAMARLG